MSDTHSDPKTTMPHATRLRRRWPPGPLGWLSYVTDHVLFGFDTPVDWLAVRLADDYGYGPPSFMTSASASLNDHELALFRGIVDDVSPAVLAYRLGLAEEALARSIDALERKLDVRGRDGFVSLAAQFGVR
jgi:DNA-binding CsgD family transcriptional regulator